MVLFTFGYAWQIPHHARMDQISTNLATSKIRKLGIGDERRCLKQTSYFNTALQVQILTHKEPDTLLMTGFLETRTLLGLSLCISLDLETFIYPMQTFPSTIEHSVIFFKSYAILQSLTIFRGNLPSFYQSPGKGR
jgi:hypothetical protein